MTVASIDYQASCIGRKWVWKVSLTTGIIPLHGFQILWHRFRPCPTSTAWTTSRWCATSSASPWPSRSCSTSTCRSGPSTSEVRNVIPDEVILRLDCWSSSCCGTLSLSKNQQLEPILKLYLFELFLSVEKFRQLDPNLIKTLFFFHQCKLQSCSSVPLGGSARWFDKIRAQANCVGFHYFWK